MNFTSIYTQGAVDKNGEEYECTEARCLMTAGRDLLLGTGRWMDTIPGEGQILRYLGNGRWDVEYTSPYQTIACLQTISYPAIGVDQTLAGVWGTNKTIVLVRDNATNTWTQTQIAGVSGSGGAQIRAFGAHMDSVTRARMVFAGQTPAGVLAGTYSQSAITWNPKPELPGQGGFRPMAFAVLNNKIYCTMGETVYVRHDGANPTWTAVSTNPNPGTTNPGLGALRGLIASPYDDGSLWMWNCSSGGTADNTNALLSLNPDTKVWKTLFAFKQGGGIQAYNTINFINNQVWIGGQRAGADYITGTPTGGFAVNVVPPLGSADLNAVRTIGVNPLNGNILMGGHDCDGKASHRTGWVYEMTP